MMMVCFFFNWQNLYKTLEVSAVICTLRRPVIIHFANTSGMCWLNKRTQEEMIGM